MSPEQLRLIELCGQQLPHPGHVCAFFDSREQKYEILAPFFKDAIDAGDEVVNIVDATDRAEHIAALVDADVPLEGAMRSGQVTVLTSEETYLHDGDDILPNLLEFLGETLVRAKQEGHRLRTCGEMNWVANGKLPVKQVLEYEARVNNLLPDHECTLVCVYDLARTPSSMMSDILATHPFVIIKGRLRENPHYVQPHEYLAMLETRPLDSSETN